MFFFFVRYSEEVFSQHSRRFSNDTNSDLSDNEMFLPDDIMPIVRRRSKAGEILASPTHRKITPTNISAATSPRRPGSARHSYRSSLGSPKHTKDTQIEELHEFYRKQIADIKQSYDEAITRLTYKLQSRQSDDEYMVSLNFVSVQGRFVYFVTEKNKFD